MATPFLVVLKGLLNTLLITYNILFPKSTQIIDTPNT